MAPQIRVHRVPFSTNVERIALACGIKGIEVEWVDHDNADRSALRALSGQDLVPVAEFGDEVVFDSPVILERLELEFPEPRLYPRDAADLALTQIFVEWFNEVWKGPPNALDEAYPNPHPAEGPLLLRIAAWTDRIDDRLSKLPYLLGEAVGVADVVAYPFLRYAVDEPDPADEQPFHRILHDVLSPGEHFGLDRWIDRMAALPQA
jgi:glutathione S-transferase